MTPLREAHFRVFLRERAIAELHLRDDFTRLIFNADYIEDPERDVLGLRFEENLRGRHTANMRLPAWFSNLLPEGKLREWIAQARGVSVEREMELLAQVGHDLPGAVRVIATDEKPAIDGAEESSSKDSPKLTTGNLWRFSLAGVGLKFSMLARGDRFVAPGVGEGGDWIIKTPEFGHADVPQNELAMMTLASLSGIDVPEVKLVHREKLPELPDHVWPRDEAYAYAIRRFDRGPNRELIHIEDLAQVRGFYPEQKYTGSFETAAALVYRNRDTESLREFARRLAFNVLIGNGDAHLKNWSLIYRHPRIPTLAPVYDLVATDPYRPRESGPEDLGLKLDGSKRFDTVKLASFDVLERKLGAKAGLVDVVVDLVKRVTTAWPQAAEILQPNDELRRGIEQTIRERSAMLGA